MRSIGLVPTQLRQILFDAFFDYLSGDRCGSFWGWHGEGGEL